MRLAGLRSVKLALDKIDQLADGCDFLFQFQIDTELLFQIHDHLDGIQRIDAETFKCSVTGDLVCRNVELRGKFCLNLLKNIEFLRCYGFK